MNNVVAESSERSIQVFRNSEQLFSNAIYVPGEVLSIVLSDISGQYVIESSVPGSFEEGGCEGRRVTESPASITMPSGGTQDDVLITAGWAFGHSQVMVSQFLYKI